MNTQVHVNKTRLSILSVPRERYWIFVSAIIQLLHNESVKSNIGSDYESSQFDSDSEDEDIYRSFSAISTNYASTIKNQDNTSKAKKSSNDNLVALDSDDESRHETTSSCKSDDGSYDFSDEGEEKEEDYFFHVAFTPDECTIICSEKIMNQKFKKPLKLCNDLNYDNIILVKEPFLNLQIDSDGSFDNSSRILELTKPLSENKIPLFFISSHFSDSVLIPYSIKEKVVSVLQKKNFEFSDISNSYIFNSHLPISDSIENGIKEEQGREDEPDINNNLENEAFRLFKEVDTKPIIDKSSKLLLTASRVTEVNSSIMKAANIISSDIIPEYFAITRTSINEVSLVLPKSEKKRRMLGFDSKHIIGSTQDIIIPISIDLSKLPIDSTGIVAGVASRIIHGIKDHPSLINYPFEMNYFSMARSAVIMIAKENIEVVSCVLNKE